jgi:uncharacterized protein YneF (UPF0154 family)
MLGTHGLALGVAGVMVCILLGRFIEKRYFKKKRGDDD